jgi:hypothetical protein
VLESAVALGIEHALAARVDPPTRLVSRRQVADQLRVKSDLSEDDLEELFRAYLSGWQAA